MHRREVAALFVESEPGPPRPLHGAPHPPQCRQDDPRTPVAGQEQWLADGDRLGLIDFDRAQPRRLRPDGDERAARRLR